MTQTFIPGKDAALEDSIARFQQKLSDLGFQIEEASWLNPVPNVWSVHIRDKECALCFTNGKGATKKAALASALGAAAGVLIGLSFNAIEPTMGTSMGLKGLAVLIMGGLGNVEGAMAGGFILGIAEVFSVAYGTSSYRDAVAFGLIILILFIRPEGLFAKAGKGGRP